METSMPSVDVAHIHEQGLDIIIIPLESAFGRLNAADQDREITAFQFRASSAGLRGRVVPVWDGGDGRMAFIAPAPWHPFFLSIDLATVAANLNRTLSW